MTSRPDPSYSVRQDRQQSQKPPPFFLGISGPSSVGKTTLAILLAQIFAPTRVLLLHADRFCKALAGLPITNGYADADGPESVDFASLIALLDSLKQNARPQPLDWHDYKPRDDDMLKKACVSDDIVQKLKTIVSSQLQDNECTLIIVEGFLLYHREDLRCRFDGKLFLRLDKNEARRRRLARPSYGRAGDQFWTTAEYFETIVWPNYVEQHRTLFVNENVEGAYDTEICRKRGILMHDDLNLSMNDMVEWAAQTVLDLLKSHVI